ncbi:MAG: DnaB-like helicase N-terminal domain-containing protein [Peptostreptococcaceae bacterium]
MNNLENIQAEQAILGAIILDNTVIFKARELNLNSSDFCQIAHKVIFEVMKKLMNEDTPVDIMTVVSELKECGHLEDVGGLSYLTSLATIVPSTANSKYYIGIVKELATKRKVVETMQIAINNISKSNLVDVATIADNLKDIVNNTNAIEDLFVDASSVKRSKSTGAVNTGFMPLDALTLGLTYGSLTVLTGEPSSGKSTLLNQIIANAIKANKNAFIYSGELPSHQLMEWFARTVANDEHLSTFTNKLGHKYKNVTDYAYDLIANWCKGKFFIYGEDSKASEKNLINTIEYLATKKGVKLFVLDNLMTIDANGKDKYENQEKVANSLKELAKKYKLAIVLVAHPNKDSAVNKNKNGHSMFDVSGASEVVNLADYVFKTIREKNAAGEESNAIIILKNRITGKQRTSVKTFFDNDRKRFCTIGMNEINVDFGYNENRKFAQISIDNEELF